MEPSNKVHKTQRSCENIQKRTDENLAAIIANILKNYINIWKCRSDVVSSQFIFVRNWFDWLTIFFSRCGRAEVSSEKPVYTLSIYW